CSTEASTVLRSSIHGALPILAKRVLNHALHGAAEHYATFQLLGNVHRRELGVEVGLPDLFDIDLNGYTHARSKTFAQTINILALDRKSTRLNSSHVKISYAVF